MNIRRRTHPETFEVPLPPDHPVNAIDDRARAQLAQATGLEPQELDHKVSKLYMMLTLRMSRPSAYKVRRQPMQQVVGKRIVVAALLALSMMMRAPLSNAMPPETIKVHGCHVGSHPVGDGDDFTCEPDESPEPSPPGGGERGGDLDPPGTGNEGGGSSGGGAGPVPTVDLGERLRAVACRACKTQGAKCMLAGRDAANSCLDAAKQAAKASCRWAGELNQTRTPWGCSVIHLANRQCGPVEDEAGWRDPALWEGPSCINGTCEGAAIENCESSWGAPHERGTSGGSLPVTYEAHYMNQTFTHQCLITGATGYLGPCGKVLNDLVMQCDAAATECLQDYECAP